MATDYDAPRKNDDEAESLDAIKESQSDKSQATLPVDIEHVGGIDPDKQALEDEIVVLPQQSDEFTCMSCFIVKHHSQMAKKKNSKDDSICLECAG